MNDIGKAIGLGVGFAVFVGVIFALLLWGMGAIVGLLP